MLFYRQALKNNINMCRPLFNKLKTYVSQANYVFRLKGPTPHISAIPVVATVAVFALALTMMT